METGNLLIQADNLYGLEYLLKTRGLSGRVTLIYADPPYGTNQTFTVTEGRQATISRARNGHTAYTDRFSRRDYLDFLGRRLELMRELLADDGSIYIHIDLKMGHYVKCLMDEIFGGDRFINDITRVKCNPKNFQRRGYGNVKDLILFYSKTDRYVWNHPREAINVEADPRFKNVAPDGRRYTTTPLHAPGETVNGRTGRSWRGMLPPPGRHWRYPPEELERLDQLGLIEWSSTGNPRKKIYADDVRRRGVKVQDVWVFKDPQKPRYPTEKNLELLRRIVGASSNAGDWVMDPFCGAATTPVAAAGLGRRWLGIDLSELAIRVCRERLSEFEFLDLTDRRSDTEEAAYEPVGAGDYKTGPAKRLSRPSL